MHSSRMRTIRNSSRPGGGEPGPGGVLGPGGVPGGVPGLGRGVPGPGRGGPGHGGMYLVLGECTCPGTPPCGQTHRCKNITFATSLRTVKMSRLYGLFMLQG